jgi:hypothetical protein
VLVTRSKKVIIRDYIFSDENTGSKFENKVVHNFKGSIDPDLEIYKSSKDEKN